MVLVLKINPNSNILIIINLDQNLCLIVGYSPIFIIFYFSNKSIPISSKVFKN
jgi:hypothetical protein